MFSHPTIWYAALLMAGLLVRLIAAPLIGGHPGDLPVLTRWAGAALAGGWLSLYSSTEANYPPLGLAVVSLSAEVFHLLRPAAAPDMGDGWWLLCLKLPMIAADGAIAGLVMWRGRHLRGALGLVWGALAAFNPVTFYLSAWWGQLESLYAAAALAALLLAEADHPWWAGLCWGMAAAFKQQGVVMLPVLVVMLACRPQPLISLAMFGAGAAGLLLTAASPFILSGQGLLMLNRLVALVQAPGWLTVNALNLWYLLSLGQANWAFNAPLPIADTDAALGPLTWRQIGLGLLLAWGGLVLWLAWLRRASPRSWALAAVLFYLGVFLLPTQAHERYAFAAAVISLVLPLYGPKVGWQWAVFFAMINLLHWLNLVWAAPFAPWLMGAGSPAIGVVISAGFVALACSGLALLSNDEPHTARH